MPFASVRCLARGEAPHGRNPIVAVRNRRKTVKVLVVLAFVGAEKGWGGRGAKQTILRGKWAWLALFSRFLENVWYIRGVNNSYLLAILTGVQPYVGPNAAELAAMLAQCDAALTDINSLLADMPKGSTD